MGINEVLISPSENEPRSLPGKKKLYYRHKGNLKIPQQRQADIWCLETL